MKKLVLAAAVFAALAAAPAAYAGCWATVKLSSLPDGSSMTWNVNLRPLQHGRTPLPAAKPRIEIRAEAATQWIVFRPKSKTPQGLFRFSVHFPGSGTYSLRVWDGFEPHCARYHTYAKVDIGL